MSQSFGPPLSISSPITQSGRVVINAVKDTYSIYKRRHSNTTGDATDEDQLFHVLPHELAFRDMDRRYESQTNSYDNRVAVITSVNGADQEAMRNMAFMGVAATRALHDENNPHNNEEDCVVQVGGLCTVINNSSSAIAAGDWVCYDFPNLDDTYIHAEGVPSKKRTAIVRSLNDILGRGAGTSAATDTYLSGYLMGERLARNRVFGRAMSTAQSGEQLDILLGTIC